MSSSFRAKETLARSKAIMISVHSLAQSYAWCWSALVLGEVVLCALIIRFRSYTEIDWSTYMEQVAMVQDGGEYRYEHIGGTQGPLVYPAGFVWLYGGLRSLTQGLVRRAQPWFAAMLVADAAAMGAVYCRAFGERNETRRLFRPLGLALLAASRRAHSVFVLRLFNDAPCATLTHAAVLALVEDWTLAACALFSLAVSVKMSALLYAPAWYVVLAARGGHRGAISGVAICALVQLVLGWPFLRADALSYATRAFDLGRGFKHKWSVNFRWVPCSPIADETALADCVGAFSSRAFKIATLATHVGLLVVFAQRRWCRGGLWWFFRRPRRHLTKLEQVAMLFECNLVGVACARSLHFQFCVWYANSLPFLLACVELPLLARALLLVALEAAWNPWGGSDSSSPASSLLLTLAHATLLLALLASPWVGKEQRSKGTGGMMKQLRRD